MRLVFAVSSLVLLACSPPERALFVKVSGNCSGKVTKNGEPCTDAECDGSLGDRYLAASSDGCTFVGWKGVCSGSGPCGPAVAGNLLAQFRRDGWPFTWNVAGRGTGRLAISAGPRSFECAGSCSEVVPVASTVTTTALASDRAVFTGFTGACEGTLPCQLLSDGRKEITATFAEDPGFRVSISLAGNGSGRVTSSPPGLSCETEGGSCSAKFPANATVQLLATPAAGSLLSNWSNVLCAGPSCVLTVDGDLEVGATFLRSGILKLGVDGGSGVSVELNGVIHPLPFERELALGSRLTLQALVRPEEISRGWSGVSCEQARPQERCTFTLSSDTTATLAVATWLEWQAGGTLGFVNPSQMVELPNGNLAVVANAKFNPNFVTTLGSSSNHNNLLFELQRDGGVARFSHSIGTAWSFALVRSNDGLFGAGERLGQIPTGEPTSIQWGSFDGSLPQPDGGLTVTRFDPSLWQPVEVRAEPQFPAVQLGTTLEAGDGFVTTLIGPEWVLADSSLSAVRRRVAGPFLGTFGAGNEVVLAGFGPVLGACGDAGTPGATQPWLARLGAQGDCLDRRPFSNGSANVSHRLARRGVVAVGELGVLATGGGHFARVRKFDSALKPVWDSTELRSPWPISSIEVMRAGPNLLLAWVELVTAANDADVAFSDGSTVRCRGAPRRNLITLGFDDLTGALRWAHCESLVGLSVGDVWATQGQAIFRREQRSSTRIEPFEFRSVRLP